MAKTEQTCCPVLGKPKPPPTIPFKKQNDRPLQTPEPVPVHTIDRGTVVSPEVEDEVLNWIKDNPDSVAKLYNFLLSLVKVLFYGARRPSPH